MSSSTLQEVWDDLRRHLEWTLGAPSLVFVTSDSHDDQHALRDRLAVWAARRRAELVELDGRAEEVVDQLTDLLPRPGVTIIELSWESTRERYRVLARLNELRGRLADPRQGALVLLGPEAAAREAAFGAADLWSVRSLRRLIRREPANPMSAPTPDAPLDPTQGAADPNARLLFAGFQVDGTDMSAAARAAMGVLREAGRLSLTDMRAARHLAERGLAAGEAGVEVRVLGLIASGELAGVDDDWASLTHHLNHALALVPDNPDALRLLALIREVALRYGDLATAETAAQRELNVRRDLADRIGTPETLRDLSISLDNVGAVAQARGDWDRATTVYDESLTLAAEACHHDSSRSALDWLTWLRDHPPTPPAPPA